MFLSLDIRRRIQLIQDFEMPTVSNCVSISNDGRYIFATGKFLQHYFLSYFTVQCARIADNSAQYVMDGTQYTYIYEILKPVVHKSTVVSLQIYITKMTEEIIDSCCVTFFLL